MSRLSKRALAMAAATRQAGVDSAVTIAARTAGLLVQGFSPTAENAARGAAHDRGKDRRRV